MEQFVQHDSAAGLKRRPHGHDSHANRMCIVIKAIHYTSITARDTHFFSEASFPEKKKATSNS